MTARILLLSLFFSAMTVWAAEKTVTRTFHTEDADPEELRGVLEQLKSPEGKVIVYPGKSMLIIQDQEKVIEQMAAVIKEATAPAPLIRVELTLDERGRDTRSGVDLWGRGGVVVDGNRVRVSPAERNVLGVDIANDSRTSSHLSSQFLLVKSGRSAVIKVGEDVPFVDYFWSYAYGLGILYDTQVRWQEIGTQMRVFATARGEWIDIEIIPEITALTGDAFSPVSFRTLATQVTLRNGQAITIGGFSKADGEFNRRFFFGTRSANSLTGSFTLRARIQK